MSFLLPHLFLLGFISWSSFFADSFTTPKLIILSLATLALLAKKQLQWRSISAVCFLLPIWPVVTLFFAVNPLKGGLFLAQCALAALPLLFFAPRRTPDTASRFNLETVPFYAAGIISAHALTFWVSGVIEGCDLPFFHLFIPADIMGNPWLSAQFGVLTLWFLPKTLRGRHIIVGIILLHILSSGSKTAQAGLLLWLILQLPTRYSNKSRLVFLVGAISFAGLFWWSHMPDGFLHAITQPETYLDGYDRQSYIISKRDPLYSGKTHSMISRVILFRNTLAMLNDHPLGGTGAGQFEIYYPRYSRKVYRDPNVNGWYRPVSPHNLLLSAAVEMGLPWALLFGFFILHTGLRFSSTNHRIAWFYFITTGMWQPMSLTFPMFFLFLSAPSSPKRQEPSLLVRRVVLSILIVTAISWIGFECSSAINRTFRHGRDISNLFPFLKAEQFNRESDRVNAHLFFGKALKRDPWGPETLYNYIQTLPPSEESLRNQHELLLRDAFPYFRPFCKDDQMKSPTRWNTTGLDLKNSLAEVYPPSGK
jgi:hypothetical protein